MYSLECVQMVMLCLLLIGGRLPHVVPAGLKWPRVNPPLHPKEMEERRVDGYYGPRMTLCMSISVSTVTIAGGVSRVSTIFVARWQIYYWLVLAGAVYSENIDALSWIRVSGKQAPQGPAGVWCLVLGGT